MANLIQKRNVLLYGRRAKGTDPLAQSHFDRVIADGGIIPAGLNGLNEYVKRIRAERGGDLSTLLSGVEAQYTGLKTAAGTGATAGGRACAKVYNLVGATGDFTQTSAANQPLALVHSGVNYAWLPGVSGNNFTTPSVANNELVTNFSIEFRVQPSTLIGTQVIACKDGGGPFLRQFQFRFNNTLLELVIDHSSGTQITYNSTANVPFSANQVFWVRVSRNSTTGIIKFFTSADGITYTQLGSDISGYVGALSNPNRIVEIGSTALSVAMFSSIIYEGKIFKDDTFTTPTQIFKPQNYNRATSQTTMTSSTGEVWTLNTPETNNGLKAAFVDRTMIMGNGISYGMRAASLNMVASSLSSYTVFRKFLNTVSVQIITELGTAIGSAKGKYFGINFTASQEEFGIHANVGAHNSRYTNTSLNLKLATQILNIAKANEASPYLINDISQSFVANDLTANNTADMNATGYNLLARNNAAILWANAIFCSDLVFAGEDNSTVRTNMYNAIRQFTNGI